MTQKEKELLLKDLCGRLPYGVKITDGLHITTLKVRIDTAPATLAQFIYSDGLKYYLRPMSSMTEEEKQIMDNLWKDNNKLVFADPGEIRRYRFYDISVVDFLNSHYFDYRGLIPMGLAIEAPEGMYN